MPIAKLDRTQLQALAEARIAEARVLLDTDHFTGSYYFSGLAVECALKAYLASKVRQHDFPDRDFINAAYTHKLEKLAQLDAVLWSELRIDVTVHQRFGANWSIVKDWDDSRRYDFVEKSTAHDMFQAVAEDDGFLAWIKRRW